MREHGRRVPTGPAAERDDRGSQRLAVHEAPLGRRHERGAQGGGPLVGRPPAEERQRAHAQAPPPGRERRRAGERELVAQPVHPSVLGEQRSGERRGDGGDRVERVFLVDDAGAHAVPVVGLVDGELRVIDELDAGRAVGEQRVRGSAAGKAEPRRVVCDLGGDVERDLWMHGV